MNAIVIVPDTSHAPAIVIVPDTSHAPAFVIVPDTSHAPAFVIVLDTSHAPGPGVRLQRQLHLQDAPVRRWAELQHYWDRLVRWH